MSARAKHLARVAELSNAGTAFVQATVVRAQCPTSARPGDAAIVLADGSIEGFIGGQCAEGSVRSAALPLLQSGEALLLRILPDDTDVPPNDEGAMTVVNPCLSGGAVEVFLEPKLPAPCIAIIGSTPIADALEVLAGQLGFATSTSGSGVPELDGCVAAIVSSHGRYEVEAILGALDARVAFIGLVASSVRGQAVLDELDLAPEQRKAVHTPVGLDIGATTAEEIALSILADIVRAIRREGLVASNTKAIARPESAIDPVCGMTVLIDRDTPHLHVEGTDWWFCNPGCRIRHAEEIGVAH